eukprot:901938_1
MAASAQDEISFQSPMPLCYPRNGGYHDSITTYLMEIGFKHTIDTNLSVNTNEKLKIMCMRASSEYGSGDSGHDSGEDLVGERLFCVARDVCWLVYPALENRFY